MVDADGQVTSNVFATLNSLPEVIEWPPVPFLASRCPISWPSTGVSVESPIAGQSAYAGVELLS
jgi:hypothetical protein